MASVVWRSLEGISRLDPYLHPKQALLAAQAFAHSRHSYRWPTQCPSYSHLLCLSDPGLNHHRFDHPYWLWLAVKSAEWFRFRGPRAQLRWIAAVDLCWLNGAEEIIIKKQKQPYRQFFSISRHRSCRTIDVGDSQSGFSTWSILRIAHVLTHVVDWLVGESFRNNGCSNSTTTRWLLTTVLLGKPIMACSSHCKDDRASVAVHFEPGDYGR